jgi:hypothetical protein
MMDTRVNAGNLQLGKSNLGGAYIKWTRNGPFEDPFKWCKLEVYCANADIVAEEEDEKRRRRRRRQSSKRKWK